MSIYLDKDNPEVMVVYDDLNGLRHFELTHHAIADRKIEALKGQDCPCGCWDLFYWQRVKNVVESGQYELSL